MLRQISAAALLFATASSHLTVRAEPKLSVHIAVADGILNGSTDGHVQLLFAPAGTDPLEDTDVTSSPNYFFGQNVFNLSDGGSVILSGGDGVNTDFGIWGFPNASMDEIEPAEYTVQAFLNIYERVTRADGSTVSLRFPCGDGAPGLAGYGTPFTSLVNATVTGESQTIDLVFDNITAPEDFTGNEIGGCQQGNYEDTEFLKYVKIRSQVLSEWWGRDVYLGANVLLPYGYDANDTSARYPVVYSQGHWPADSGAFHYSSDEDFAGTWDNGTVPATNETAARNTPKMIIITFRHETPYYDDSYAVNTANLGPWGDAINEELIPHIDGTFNTIPEAYARIQEGGSTGGWESAASLIYRPDLFGACFSSYPDSLDFHRHQDIPLYTNANAYVRDNGSAIPSIRELENGTEVVLATVAQENSWELTHGTSTRSFQQWDIWNAVFGAQGLNGYPLEPWDKVTGEIYPKAVEYWKPFDLSNWITSNWDNEYNLGEVLKGRVHVYVGTADNYYLNEGVAEFQSRVAAKGGAGWANFTFIEGNEHGGIYNGMDVWDYLDLLQVWFEDHAPDGKTPLSPSVTISAARGNKFDDVITHGGHEAALARQAAPSIEKNVATVGRWDPGVALEAQWFVNGKPCGSSFEVKEGQQVTHSDGEAGSLQLQVTGRKRGYVKETRKSSVVTSTS
jgi:enterochelin esterase-like enzyme